MDFFSPAQIVGYFAFVLGITAFLQKNDRPLMLFNAIQSLVYALHFVLLGNFPASASSAVSASRSFAALRTRSWLWGALFLALNVAAGVAFAQGAAGWLPVVGSCAATIGIFTLTGIRLRLVLLSSTLLWLANNVLSRSIGGTCLELCIATANISTMIRMAQANHSRPTPRVSTPLPEPIPEPAETRR